MVDVFISYKREDRLFAEALASLLEQEGQDVWWDVDLLPGARFSEEIRAVIQNAGIAVVLWSQKSINSTYVLDEAALARDLSKLIPVRLDDCEIPIGFMSIHTYNLTGWTGSTDDPRLAGLLSTIRQRAKIDRTLKQGNYHVAPKEHQKTSNPEAEARLWRSIMDNKTPTKEEYIYYLNSYPSGNFAELAQLRIREMDQKRYLRLSRNIGGFALSFVVFLGALFALVPQGRDALQILSLGEYFDENPSEKDKSNPVSEDYTQDGGISETNNQSGESGKATNAEDSTQNAAREARVDVERVQEAVRELAGAEEASILDNRQATGFGITDTPDSVSKSDKKIDAGTEFERAMQFLRQAEYDKAADAMRTFVVRHSDHGRADDAMYWAGESDRVKGNYESAAETFANGYLTYSESDMAPDMLLKLGLSLGELNRTDDACEILLLFVKLYRDHSSIMTRRAEGAIDRVCS